MAVALLVAETENTSYTIFVGLTRFQGKYSKLLVSREFQSSAASGNVRAPIGFHKSKQAACSPVQPQRWRFTSRTMKAMNGRRDGGARKT
jgi:hypothetical protein